MINKDKLKRRFSRNAKHYDKYASVQKKMGDTLIKTVMDNDIDVHKIKNILEVGCGTGYVTRKLYKQCPNAKITAVDIAPGMIEQIKLNTWDDSVNFICGDIEEINIDNKYDLIISNATFQWFNNIDTTIEKLISALNINGILCFSTFGKNTFSELHKSFEKAREVMDITEPITPGQAFYSLDELCKLCQSVVSKNSISKEILLQDKEMFEYEYFDSCKEFLNSIKKIGANNSNKSGNIVSPAFIEKVMEIYDENFKEDNQVKATYHCLFMKMTLV